MRPNFPPTRPSFGPRFAKGALLLLAATLLLGWAVQALWNAVLPAVLPTVGLLSYGQAVGLLVLCRLLVGGWGGGGRFGGGAAHRRGPDFGKWQRLSPEQRQQFRQRWQGRQFGERGEGEQ